MAPSFHALWLCVQLKFFLSVCTCFIQQRVQLFSKQFCSSLDECSLYYKNGGKTVPKATYTATKHMLHLSALHFFRACLLFSLSEDAIE